MKDLFDLNLERKLKTTKPLASRMRPRNLDEFIGQEHLLGEDKFLRKLILNDNITSMIFYGPAGVGKTTLAKVIANTTERDFIEISAVTSNIKELREVIKRCEDSLGQFSRKTIVFIDEVHRFNKAQQDALLPHVEKGLMTLIGATTENPYFEINRALLSRVLIVNLRALNEGDLNELIDRALLQNRGLKNLNLTIESNARKRLVESCRGDGRELLNNLEIAALNARKIIKIEDLDFLDYMDKSYSTTDKYNNISAFIKSIRGSDPDAAIHYLAKMLNAGEDIKYIARRLIISASEDISNADPMALLIANAAFENVMAVGMPEASIILAQATTYLATADKSDRSYRAINEAMKDLREKSPDVCDHLKDRRDPNILGNKKYINPHNFDKKINQKYMPDEFSDRIYYKPKNIGYERIIKKKMEGE